MEDTSNTVQPPPMDTASLTPLVAIDLPTPPASDVTGSHSPPSSSPSSSEASHHLDESPSICMMDDPVRIWAPSVIEDVDKVELGLFLDFTTSACIPGACCNIEEALEILYESKGNIKMATQRLLNDRNDSKRDQTIWTLAEVQTFEGLIGIYGKNFHIISKALQNLVNHSTKSVKDCVKFYYLWKKSSFKSGYAASNNNCNHTINTTNSNVDSLNGTVSITPPIKNESPDCVPNNINNDDINTADDNNNVALLVAQPGRSPEVFPCKVCGRIFEKIKSRSAHMKRHKNERLGSSYAT